MSNFCSACGAKPLPGSRFCWKCGASIVPGETPREQGQPAAASGCSSCGAQLPAGARFCAKCGESVSTGQAAPEPAQPSASKPPAANAASQASPEPAQPSGSKQTAANECSSCGAKLLPGGKFCNKCGHAVVKPPAAEPPPETTPKAAPAEVPGEVYEEETIELGRVAVRQSGVQQPPVQPAAQVPARPRSELYERRTVSRALPLERPRRRWFTALVVLAVVLVAVAGAGGAVFLLGLWPGAGDGEAQTVELVASNMAFSPSEIRVQPGRDVKVHFVNNDAGVRHQFVLYGDHPDSPLAQGKVVVGPGEDSITFSPPPAGRYVFQCGLHPEMSGTFIVAGQKATSTPSRTATSTATPRPSPTATPTPMPLSIRYAIAAHIWPEPLNVRPDPSTKNKELVRLSEGERLEVISGPTYNDGRNWWKVRLADGREGYMAGEFLFLSYAAFGVAEEDNNGVAVLAVRDADILKDGSLLLSLAFTNVSTSTQGWTSDAGNTNIYLTDESGERYASLEVGGAFGADVPAGLKPNETLTGWHRFSAPPDLLDRLSTGTLDSLGVLTLHYPNHQPIVFTLR